MTIKNPKFFYTFLLIIPALFVFKSIIFGGNVAWGDAPFFYPEGLRALLSEPMAWTARGNALGGPNALLWISPIMILYGALHAVFGLGNGIIVRVLFYIPAIILSMIGPYLLTRSLGYSKKVQFLGSLVYVFNTYFILLMDGGQVGVALAYGMFPVSLLFLKNLISNPTRINYFIAFIATVALGIFDPRVLIICYLTIFLWETLTDLSDRKFVIAKYFPLILITLSNLFIFSYWLYPLVKAGSDLGIATSKLNLVSIVNPLFLYQPHWPGNIFGQVTPPPFYFAIMLICSISALLFKKTKKEYFVIALLILLFSFLAKGRTPPVQEVYSFILRLPLGAAFRDSSKFFIPVVLFTGVLIGLFVDKLKQNIFLVAFYIFVLFLIKESLFGQMNFVLSGRPAGIDFTKINGILENESGFVRTAWFSERQPMSYDSAKSQAIDAKDLAELRPFSRINTGTFDKFNYFNNSNYIDWYRLLGIKYLVLSGQPRKIEESQEEKDNFNNLKSLMSNDTRITKINSDNPPIFEIPDTLPHIYQVSKMIAVIGPDDIYDVLRGQRADFKLENQAFIFLEDGKVEPSDFDALDKEAITIVFNGKDENDLKMSFLKDWFVEPDKNLSEWSLFSREEYPLYKYQLLIRKYKFDDFDYARGISFSERDGEKLSFTIHTQVEGNYRLIIRGKGAMEYSIAGQAGSVNLERQNLSWFEKPISLPSGNNVLTLTNKSQLAIVNVAALIPESEMVAASAKATSFLQRYGAVDINNLGSELSNISWSGVDITGEYPGRYDIETAKGAAWIVLSDSFSPKWMIRKNPLSYKSQPSYSAINAFYKRPEWTSFQIVYDGQKELRLGIYLATLSSILIAIIFLAINGNKINKRRIKN